MDICEKLKANACTVHSGAYAVMNEAAYEIERLREQMERAAIACAHQEAQIARKILLDALAHNGQGKGPEAAG